MSFASVRSRLHDRALLGGRDGVHEDRHDVGLLAVMRRVGRVAEEPASGIPRPGAGRGAQRVGELSIAPGLGRRPQGVLQHGRALEGVGELEADQGRVAVPPPGRHAPRPLGRPVDVGPPRNRTHEAALVHAPLEPADDAPDPGQEAADELGVVPVHPVVVDHGDPEQREGRDVLAQARRVAAGRDPLRDPGEVEVREGLSDQPVVARHVERDQGLDAGVAHVLELLVVGRVEVGLEGAEARAAPVDRPHVGEPGGVAREAGPQLERVGREDAVQVVDAQLFAGRLDLDLDVPVGAEPQRLEAAPFPSVGTELVLDADDRLPLDLVAVPLPALLVLQRLGVREAERAPRPPVVSRTV